MRLALAASATLAFVAAQPAIAADYYAGKTINLIVGSAPGGGYDTYARVVARHLPKFLPGNPLIIVQNMDGASSRKAAGYINKIAAKDGTVIGAISPGAVIGPLLEDGEESQYDPTKLIYLATANVSTRVCASYTDSKIKTFDDAMKQEMTVGSEASGGSTRDYGFLHKNTSHAKIRVISGYKGTPSITLAMERGEVDGICGIDWSSLRAQKQDMLRDGKLNILIQAGLEPNDELTKMGVPMVWKYINNEEDKQVAELVIAQQLFGRPYIAPPGTPPEVVKILRTAFEKALNDPELLADAEKMRIDISFAGGERVQEGVERVYAAPKNILEKARDAIKQ
jgi:tripartite-type tricarboxylate transporter receptor subunit TctC